MAKTLLEERIAKLEDRVQEMEKHLLVNEKNTLFPLRGWRAFVGVDADNPAFAEVVRLGREWRFADGPMEEVK